MPGTNRCAVDPSARVVDIYVNGALTLDNFEYGKATGYLALPAGDYSIAVAGPASTSYLAVANGVLNPAGMPSTVVAGYTVDLSGAAGAAVSVLASGFLNPSANNDGSAFGLLAVLADGTTFLVPTATSIDPVGDARPGQFRLEGNYPNPFNPSTQIRFTLDTGRQTRLAVYDILGREVAVLVNGDMAPGTYAATFDASGLTSGLYLYRLTSGTRSLTGKMMLVK